jgi:hypothetical protein
MVGNSNADTSLRGVLSLNAGAVNTTSTSGRIRLATGAATNTGGTNWARVLINYDGLVHVYDDGDGNTNSGNMQIDSNLGVGTAPSTGAGVGQIDATGDINTSGGTFNSPSARRLKENIVALKDGGSIIKRLEPVYFDWKDGRKKHDAGLIADDVEKVVPNLVHYNDNGEVAGMDYSRLTPFLIAALQEQTKEIENLRQRITVLERR